MTVRYLLCVMLLMVCGTSQALDIWGHLLGRYGTGMAANGWQCCKCCDDYCPKPPPKLPCPCRPWDKCVAPPPPCKDCK